MVWTLRTLTTLLSLASLQAIEEEDIRAGDHFSSLVLLQGNSLVQVWLSEIQYQYNSASVF